MKVRFLCILFFIFNEVSGQDSLDRELIKDAIYQLRWKDSIFYIDSSLSMYPRFSALARSGKITGDLRDKNRSAVSIAFTKAELKEIDRQFSKQSVIEWPKDFLGKSIRLSFNSIDSFTRYIYARRRLTDTLIYRFYYLISKPVYARNNTVAIFRLAEMIDRSAGYNFVVIYVKENECWKLKMFKVTGAW